MLSPLTIALALAVSDSLAAPAPLAVPAHSLQIRVTKNAKPWNDGAVDVYPIHDSCNDTQTRLIRKGLDEAQILADHAKDHVLRFGNSSAHFVKYFGNSSTGAVIGNYERIINGDKGHTLFRCDNPDGNCQIPTYGGHWRGSNATNETVICDLSYNTRLGLESMCMHGYTVSQSPSNTYWASDLMHRLYHMPATGDDVSHYAEDYFGVIELAQHNASYSSRDSDTLQFFALEVYAYDIVVPGVGCAGPVPTAHSTTTAAAAAAATATAQSSNIQASQSSPPQTSSAAVSAAMSAIASVVAAAAPTTSQPAPAPSTTAAPAASQVQSIPSGCHTHAGGELHCESDAPSSTVAPAASQTTGIPPGCHTHAGGVLHCGSDK